MGPNRWFSVMMPFTPSSLGPSWTEGCWERNKPHSCPIWGACFRVLSGFQEAGPGPAWV